MKPQELSNEDLIERCKILRNIFTEDNHAQHLTKLITRFERITLSQVADDAIQELHKLKPGFDFERLDVSKPQPSQDEVEELARELYVNSIQLATTEGFAILSPKQSFDDAESFIKYRNERRAGK